MEISVILNIIFSIIFGLGFLSYVVWLGFSNKRLKDKCRSLEEHNNSIREDLSKLIDESHNVLGSLVDDIEQKFDKKTDNLDSKLDRFDSRLDSKIHESKKQLKSDIDDLNNRMTEWCHSLEDKIKE